MTERLQALLKLREPLVETLLNEEVKVPHIVKRANFLTDFLNYDILPIAGNVWVENEEINPGVYNKINHHDWSYPEAASYRPAGSMTLELALFFDEAAYKIFGPHFNNDDKKLQDMLLAYMNGVSISS